MGEPKETTLDIHDSYVGQTSTPVESQEEPETEQE